MQPYEPPINLEALETATGKASRDACVLHIHPHRKKEAKHCDHAAKRHADVHEVYHSAVQVGRCQAPAPPGAATGACSDGRTASHGRAWTCMGVHGRAWASHGRRMSVHGHRMGVA
eukprot:354499-Chlamydomonas_euryale.AAC.3